MFPGNPAVKNYPFRVVEDYHTPKCIFPAAAATADVPDTSSCVNPPPEKFTVVTLRALLSDLRSVCDS